MAALQELLDEQARIKNELQRMEDSEETTEEADGDLRDTLLQRWEELDEKTKPLIERMEKIRNITRVASDEANLERPAGTIRAQDQYAGQSNIARHILLTGSEEYQDAFRMYLEDPQGEAQRAALSLTLANGGYLLPFILDQVPVA